MRWYIPLVFAVTLLLVACGSGNSDAAIRETAEGFYQALAVDPPRAYTYLAQECKDEISFIEFASSSFIFSAVLGENEPEVQNLQVIGGNDDEITASFDVVIVTEGETVPLAEDSPPNRFVKEAGRWRFADCEDFSFFGLAGAEAEAAAATTPTASDAVAVEADDDPTLPGEYVDLPAIYGGFYGNPDGPHTAAHVRRDIDYVADGNSNPPAGGPHWGSGACGSDPTIAPPFCGPAPWGIYREPWEAETLVHNMEHAGVVLWYNTSDQQVIDDMEQLFVERLNDGHLLVMAPYPDMEEEHIALTSWSRIDKFPVSEYRPERVAEFIDVHERRFNPEAF